MSEITKLYENAHIEKVINHECTYDYGITCPNDNDTCENCGYYKEKEPDYPPFTAEKQLEIIVFFVNKGYNVIFSNLSNKFSLEQISKSIAQCINSKWNNLTESEQEQIRSILNG